MDPYRSRGDAGAEIAARFCPVVWGDAPGPLAPDALAAYRVRGFHVWPALFDAGEVAALLEEAHRLAGAADHARDDVILEPGTRSVRSLFRVHRDGAVMARLVDDPRLRDVARQILGGDVYVHQSRVNFKPAFDGRAFPWHSDFETWHVEDGMPRMRALSVSIFLSENVEQNGPLLLVAGSHRHYVRCVGRTPAEHFRQSLRQQAYGVPDQAALTKLVAEGGLVSAVGPAGTAVFFDCNVMHGSTANMTPWPRHNVFLVYNSVENRLVAPFGGSVPRPTFLAEREPGRAA
jgi:ectoine hydroxylase